MSFLDNLENSLKALESREERDPAEQARRDEQRAQTLATAPWAERLKTSAYVKDLLNETAAAGHRIRAKVYIAWLDNTLRLEARGTTCEVAPTGTGVVARYQRLSDGAAKTEEVDLQGDPKELLERWLS